MFETLTVNVVTVLAVMASLGFSVWSLSWWLSGQFASIRKLIYERIEQAEQILLRKLEYHEKHDDQRFMAIHNDIWELKVRNAARDGIALSRKEPRPMISDSSYAKAD